MSSRVVNRVKILDQTISGTNPILTKAMVISSFSNYAFQGVYSSGLTASFKILGSIDGTTFVDTGASIASISGSAGSFLSNTQLAGYWYVKLQITPSSGSASFQVWFSAKEA